jgi:uncharacterized RDD family membrane protein YckC
MDEWFYALNGVQQGPIQRAALLQLLSSGQVPPDSLVWREGMAEWVPAHSVSEFSTAGLFGAGGAAVASSPLNYGLGNSVYASPPLNYASFGIRFGAWIIDFIVVLIGSFIVGAILGFGLVVMSGNRGAAQSVQATSNILGIVLSWLYYSLMQSSSIQGSLGMMAVGLRVTDEQGRRISFGRATGRYFASILSGCLVGIGYLMILWSPRQQALHDQIAGTVVLVK